MKLLLVMYLAIGLAGCGEIRDEKSGSPEAAANPTQDQKTSLDRTADTEKLIVQSSSSSTAKIQSCSDVRRAYSGYVKSGKKAAPPKVYLYDNPDPFGVDYEYYYIDSAVAPTNGQVSCTELPGFTLASVPETDLIQGDIAAALQVSDKKGRITQCSIDVWNTLDGTPTSLVIKRIPSPQGSSRAPKTKEKAEKLCVKAILS